EGSGTVGDIWILDLKRAALPARFTFAPEDEMSPIWSPDGTQIVYGFDNRSIYRKAANGAGSPEELFKSSSTTFPYDWSPDGRFIAFDSTGAKTARDLWILPLTGDRKPIVFLQTDFSEMFPRFSPDGKWISYTSNEGGGQDIYVRPFPASDRQV